MGKSLDFRGVKVSRKQRLAIGAVAGLLLLVVVVTGLWVLVRNLPGIHRLVCGDPSILVSGIFCRDAVPESIGTEPGLSPVPQIPSSKSEWIAFETQRGAHGDYEILATTPDGLRLVNLSNCWADDVAPVWAPDGKRLAFVSFRDTVAGKWGMGPGSIYVMDFDPENGTGGENAMRVTDRDMNAGWPTWSPDGRRIAFHSDLNGEWDIWIIDLESSKLTNLTNHPSDDRYPAWSPDGDKIAFTSKRSGQEDIWLMNVDGSDARNLTPTPGRDRYPMWSPDGRRIAFNTNRDGDQEIYVMDADGQNQANVTNSPDSTEGLADWSPDGKRWVLYSDRPANKDVFVLDLVTGEWTNITSHPASDEFCTWSP